MALTSMVATFGNMLWFYFLPTYYSTRFSASPTQISLIYAAWVAIGGLGSTPAGALADIIGRKTVIVISSFVSALSIFILAISHNFLLSALALPISGLGSSFFLVSNTLIAESVGRERRGAAFGYFSALSSVAAAASPLLGGITIASKGYFPLFVTGGFLTLAAAIARAYLLKETLHLSNQTKRSISFGDYVSSARSILRNRSLLVLVLAYSIYNLFVQQSSFITPLYASKVLGYSTVTSGILFSSMLFAVALSKIYFGKLSDKIGRKKVVELSWILESATVYLFVFANSLPVAIAGVGLWMLFGAMDAPAINAWLAEAADAGTRGLSMGIFYTITFLPTVPAVVLSGYLFSIGPRLPFYANSAVSIFALILLFAFSRTPENFSDNP